MAAPNGRGRLHLTPLQEGLARLSNAALDDLESQVRQARAETVSRRKALDAFLREIRRDRGWRETGRE